MTLPLLLSLISAFAAAPTSRAQAGDTFSYPMPLDPQRLEWSVRHDYRYDSLLLFNVMEGLVEIGPRGEPVPALAEKWDVSADGLTYTFHLRKDVKWTDGAPLRAADFVYGWRRVLNPATHSGYEFYLYDVAGAEAYHGGRLRDFSKVGVKAPDDHTFEVRLGAREPYFVSKLYFYIAFPQREDVAGRAGAAFDPLKLVTLGPYRISRWEKKKSLQLTVNPGYYGPAPAVKTVNVVIEPRPEKLDELADAGKLDILLKPTTSQIVKHTVDSKTPWALKRYESLNIIYLGFNTTRGATAKTAFRQAIGMALDRSGLPGKLANGTVAAEGLLPKSLAEYAPAALAIDVDQARRSLLAAGYADGAHVPPLKLLYEAPDRAPIAEYVRDVLARNLGVAVELTGVSLADLTRSMRLGKYDLFLSSWVADYFGPSTFFDMMRPDSGFNLTGWKSAKYEETVVKAESSLNEMERDDLYTAAQYLLFRTDAVLVPICHQKISVLVGDRVSGFELFPTLPYFYFKRITMK